MGRRAALGSGAGAENGQGGIGKTVERVRGIILPALLEEVAAVLRRFELNDAFVVGSVVDFLVDHCGLSPMRSSDDLDILVGEVT